jgi:novel plant SNARE
LTEEISAVQQLLDGIPSLSDPVERATSLDEVEGRLRSAKGTMRSFKMEIRLVADVQQRRQYEGRLQQMDQEYRTLQADFKALQAEENRGQLFISGSGADGDLEGGDPTQAGSNMLNEASALQDKTADSLANTRNMIQQSKEVGAATLEELERQREVITSIDREADKAMDNLERAEKLIKTFGKRMAGDKLIQCFAVVNMLLLLGVIVFAITRRGGKDDDEKSPANPF